MENLRLDCDIFSFFCGHVHISFLASPLAALMAMSGGGEMWPLVHKRGGLDPASLDLCLVLSSCVPDLPLGSQYSRWEGWSAGRQGMNLKVKLCLLP